MEESEKIRRKLPEEFRHGEGVEYQEGQVGGEDPRDRGRMHIGKSVRLRSRARARQRRSGEPQHPSLSRTLAPASEITRAAEAVEIARLFSGNVTVFVMKLLISVAF